MMVSVTVFQLSSRTEVQYVFTNVAGLTKAYTEATESPETLANW